MGVKVMVNVRVAPPLGLPMDTFGVPLVVRARVTVRVRGLLLWLTMGLPSVLLLGVKAFLTKRSGPRTAGVAR